MKKTAIALLTAGIVIMMALSVSAASLIPATGGIGTTIFYIVGAVLVIGAGILLFVKRRMRND